MHAGINGTPIMPDTPASSDEKPAYHYWAFISYSSKDRAWAKWLHSALETGSNHCQ